MVFRFLAAHGAAASVLAVYVLVVVGMTALPFLWCLRQPTTTPTAASTPTAIPATAPDDRPDELLVVVVLPLPLLLLPLVPLPLPLLLLPESLGTGVTGVVYPPSSLPELSKNS